MKIFTLSVFTAMFCCFAFVGSPVLAAPARHDSSVDFQFRIPLHLQYIPEQTNAFGKFGIGAWVGFPDITATENESSHLLLAGPLWQYDNKGSWVEFLGGVRNNKDGFRDPLANIRWRDRSLGPLQITADLAYFPQMERRRLYSLVTADVPLPIYKYQMRCGVEAETIISFTGKADSYGAGPRLVFPIPLQRWSSHLTSSFAVAYQMRNDRDFVRCYLSLTYLFGGAK